MEKGKVEHFAAVGQGRFFIDMKVPNDAGGVKQFQSELLYKIEKQPDAKGVNISIMDLYHTFTPKELRGRGLAEKLTKAAFEFAEKNKMKIRPSCSYVADVFLKKHPEWADMVE